VSLAEDPVRWSLYTIPDQVKESLREFVTPTSPPVVRKVIYRSWTLSTDDAQKFVDESDDKVKAQQTLIVVDDDGDENGGQTGRVDPISAGPSFSGLGLEPRWILKGPLSGFRSNDNRDRGDERRSVRGISDRGVSDREVV